MDRVILTDEMRGAISVILRWRPGGLMKKILFFMIICLLVFISVGIFSARSVLLFEVRDQRNNHTIVQLLFQPQDVFYLQTIHSVVLTPYTHIYKVDAEGNIILSGAEYISGGGGFPNTGDGVFSISDGKFQMNEMNRFIGKLRFRVSPISQEKLIVSNAEIPLYKFVPEGTLIEIRVFKTWLWSYRNWLQKHFKQIPRL